MRTISRSLFLTIILGIMLADGFSQQATTNLTQQEQNKQLVKTMNELFNQGKTTEAMQYFSDSLTKMGNIGGKSFFVAVQDDIALTFPDVQTKINTLWADGDWIIAD